MQEQCVGVDVSKLQLDWALGGEGAVSRVNNTPAGVRSLTAKLRRCDAALIIVESTGGYERPLVEALAKANLPVVLVNPWRVRRFSEGMGVLAKTDPVDARILALFGERARPPRRPLPGPTQRQLADLIRRRRQLIAMVTAEKNRLDTATAVIKRDINAIVNVLERHVTKIDERIDAAIAADPEKAENWERLQTTPSVGPGVARALIIDFARTRRVGAQADHITRWARAVREGQRKENGTTKNTRWALRAPHCALPRRDERSTLQPNAQADVRPDDRGRQATEGGLHRAREKATYDPQRNGEGRNDLESSD